MNSVNRNNVACTNDDILSFSAILQVDGNDSGVNTSTSDDNSDTSDTEYDTDDEADPCIMYYSS